jgi:hypothetical protein
MPFADPARRREYDKARKQKQRAQGRTKKGLDTRLTPTEIETAEDIQGLFNEVVAEVRTADGFPDLQAELDVFKSDLTFDESADYSLQVAQQSGAHALCLVTYDLTPELIDDLRQLSIYYNYDPDFEGYVHFSW